MRNRLAIAAAGRQAWSAAALAGLVAAVYWGAFWVRFEGAIPAHQFQVLLRSLPLVLLVKVAAFAALKQLGGSRFVTFHDLVALIRAASLGSVLLVVVDFASTAFSIPRSVAVIDWGGTLLAVGGMRMLVRLIEEREPPRLAAAAHTPVFIVGANRAGETLLRTIRRHRELAYRIVGFIAAEPSQLHQRIGGVPVRGTLDETCDLAEKHGVREVLITAGDLDGGRVRELVEQGQRRSVSVKVLPGIDQLLGQGVDLRPREVSIEDLLRREPVSLRQESLRSWLQNKVLMVTGSAGSIGSEIAAQLSQFAPGKLILVDRSETGQFFLDQQLRDACRCPFETCIADVTDGRRMSQLFRELKPDIVFHAAAYKHVPLMEAHPGEAVKNIALATRMLADLAHQHGIESFVMVSTDKAVNPTSVMGTCKRVAELYVQALSGESPTRFVTVRFGNVLDSAGSVIPLFRRQIAAGGPLTVTHPEMTRYFMTIPEASQLVIQAGAMGSGGEIFVLDMGEPVKIVDLARDLIRLSGLRERQDVEIQFVGMRPGEKLFEELHVEGERHLPTEHPKIMVAQSDPLDLESIRGHLSDLAELTEQPAAEIVGQLQSIVPQYRRQRRRAA